MPREIRNYDTFAATDSLNKLNAICQRSSTTLETLMKLIRAYESSFEAEEMAERLERKGVLPFVSSKDSHRISRHATGATKVGLWVVLDHQYDDALSIVRNPKHEAKTALSKSQISHLKSQRPSLLKAMLKILGVAIILSVVSVYLSHS